MKRFTTPGMQYTARQLSLLQAYEDTGFKPDEITPKPGSPADLNIKATRPKKHDIYLVSRSTPDNKKTFWGIKMDGKELSVDEFGTAVGINGSTVRGWVTKRVFEQKIRERGLI